MSAASGGSVWVSSAITSSPAWRALSRDGTIALESLGVIIRPLAPAEIRLSTAATWLSLSPSFLPAKDCRSAPSFLAWASAPSFIFTKNGFVSVLVIRPTVTSSPPPPPPPPPEPPSSLPHATRPAPRANTDPAAATRRAVRLKSLLLIATSSSSPPDEAGLRERFQAPHPGTRSRACQAESENVYCTRHPL